jgi:hypothetical protein
MRPNVSIVYMYDTLLDVVSMAGHILLPFVDDWSAFVSRPNSLYLYLYLRELKHVELVSLLKNWVTLEVAYSSFAE